jgi:hypothetical protein
MVALRLDGLVALQYGNVELVPCHGLYMDFQRALGLDALSLRQLGLFSRLRLVLDAHGFDGVFPSLGFVVFRAGMDWLGSAGCTQP